MSNPDELFSLRPRVDDHMRELDRLSDEIKFLRQNQIDQLAKIYSSVEKCREIVELSVDELKREVKKYTISNNRRFIFLIASISVLFIIDIIIFFQPL